MSVPVISTTTSILGYNQYESWQYQPYATNTPTSWGCPNLPDGMSIDSTTGLISGAATVSGVFECGLTATNGDGTSVALVLTIGIAAAAATSAILTNSGYQITIDVGTKAVTVGSVSTSASAAAAGLTLASDPGTSPTLRSNPILYARRNDSLLFWINFVKNGVPLNLTIATLKIAIKEFEGSARIVLGHTFYQVGSGVGSYFGLYCDLSSASGLDA